METKRQKEKHRTDTLSGITGLRFLDYIKEYVKKEREKTLLNYDEFFSSLKRWWCHHYSRPYKDPLLDQYSIEELYYEYCNVNYTTIDSGNTDPVNSPDIPQEEWDWAEEEERKELEQSQTNQSPEPKDDIIQDEKELSDEEWYQKHGSSDLKINPTAKEADQGGDIIADFGAFNE